MHKIFYGIHSVKYVRLFVNVYRTKNRWHLNRSALSKKKIYLMVYLLFLFFCGLNYQYYGNRHMLLPTERAKEVARRNKFCLLRFFCAKKSVARFTVPPLSQRVTLGLPVCLQAHSQRLAVANNSLRVCTLAPPVADTTRTTRRSGRFYASDV